MGKCGGLITTVQEIFLHFTSLPSTGPLHWILFSLLWKFSFFPFKACPLYPGRTSSLRSWSCKSSFFSLIFSASPKWVQNITLCYTDCSGPISHDSFLSNRPPQFSFKRWRGWYQSSNLGLLAQTPNHATTETQGRLVRQFSFTLPFFAGKRKGRIRKIHGPNYKY